MADSIVRLRVENSEYDAKIKRATQGLQHMEEACHKAGGTLAVLEKEEKDFVAALGKMETVSRDARGRVNELSTAFVNLSAQYKRLTDEEKKGDYGKALSASLAQLKTRINDAKDELKKINGEINSNGSLLDQLSSKVGLSVGQLTTWGAALGASKLALDVMKDAFFNNEEQLDEWGRTVTGAQSLYQGFLDSLNTGDISGYLERIGAIIAAARDAYDALDNLATYNAFNQVNVEKARTGFTESMADYRSGKGSKADVQNAGAEMKKQLQERQKMENEAYLAEIKRIAKTRGVNEADLRKAMSGSYGNYQQLKSTPMTGVKKTLSTDMDGQSIWLETKVAANQQEKLGAALRRINDTELQSLQALGAQAQRTATEVAQVDKQMARVLSGGKGGSGTGKGKTGKTETPKTEEQLTAEEIKKLTNEYITATDERKEAIRGEIDVLKERQGIIAIMKKDAMEGTVGESVKSAPISNAGAGLDSLKGEKISIPVEPVFNTASIAELTSNIQKELSVSTIGSDLFNALTANLQDSTNISTIIQTCMQAGIDSTEFNVEDLWRKIFNGENIENSVWEDLAESINEKIDEMDIKGIKLKVEGGNVEALTKNTKDASKAAKTAASAFSGIGQAMEAIDDPAAKVIGIVAEAIANIAGSFALALKDTKGGPWEWIAAAIAGTATMISTIAAIKSATGGGGGTEKHAGGGFIGGNSLSGDNLLFPIAGGGLAGLNSGELVLNRAQQNNLATQLGGGVMSNLQLECIMDGEDMRIVLNNGSLRRGKGEYLTAN